MANEESHVDWAVERVEEQIHVHVFPQLAAQDPAAKRGVGLLAAWFQKTFAKRGDQLAVVLSRAQHGGDDASTPAAKDFYKLTHLLAHVRTDGTGVREMKLAGRATCKRVGNESGLVRPPTVNRCLAHAGVSGHSFNGQLRKALFGQEFQGAAQDGLARLFTPRTPGQALPAASVAISVSRSLLAHGLNLPYNRVWSLESNTGSIESKNKSAGWLRILAGNPLSFI